MTHIIHLFRMYVISVLFQIPIYMHNYSKTLKSKMTYDRSMSKFSSFSRETISGILVHINGSPVHVHELSSNERKSWSKVLFERTELFEQFRSF